MIHRGRQHRIATLTALAVVIAGAACNQPQSVAEKPVALPRAMTIAVAPILNFSGQFDLDPVKAADLLASEITEIDGLVVLPVSRVVAVLAAEGRTQIESPKHALQIAEAVGAEAILVAGITEYNPYTPSVGVVMQLYMRRPEPRDNVNSADWMRQARPVAVAANNSPFEPVGQVQQVYHASHEPTVERVRIYAESRAENDEVLGWRRYLMVQTQFLRFCWYDATHRLFRQYGVRAAILDGDPVVEMPS